MVGVRRHFKRSSEAGTATVEFALILPIFIGLLFAIIEFGFIFRDQLLVQQIAREGARAAAVGRMVAEVRATINGAAQGLTVANLTSTLEYRVYNAGWSTWYALGDSGGSSSQNDAPQGAQVRVRCTYQHQLLTGPLFARMIGRPGASQTTLFAQMVMRRE